MWNVIAYSHGFVYNMIDKYILRVSIKEVPDSQQHTFMKVLLYLTLIDW